MAASTFPTHTLVNDTGGASAPNADGTLLNNAQFQSIFTDLNSMFAGAGAYATFTLGGKLAVEGFGAHTFSAGGTGANTVSVRNTTAGTGNFAYFGLGNDSSANRAYTILYSSTFTTSGRSVADGMLVENSGAGGISYGATNATGIHRWYTGAAGTERMRLSAAGGLSVGDATDPGATNFRVAGSATIIGALSMNGAIQAADGSAASPAYTFLNDANTGFYRDTNDRISASAGGVAHSYFSVDVGHRFAIPDYDAGNGAIGPNLYIGRNTNGTSSVAGYVTFIDKAGVVKPFWVDAAGDVRVSTTNGPVAGDTTGTVVGTQTSTLDTKDLLGDDLAPDEALAVMLRTPVKRFRYKAGSYNNTIFHGIIADWSPEFAMDNGRVFSPVTAHGYSVLAIQALEARIRTLERAA